MRLLITGADSQLGRCLQDLPSKGKNIILAANRNKLNINSSNSIDNIFEIFTPSIVINTAAYTAVDKAEIEKNQAFATNQLGVSNLAKACKKDDIPLIHISTDYVFDGTARKPYKPDDLTNPKSIYGKSKLAGEKEVIRILKKHIIIRTAWLFSEYGGNFFNTILSLVKNRKNINVVNDQYGCPTYSGDLAKSILRICELISAGNQAWGTYNYCGDQQVSWYEFAESYC